MSDPFETLADKPLWLAWREEQRDGKPTKVPYSARTGGRASATDPSTWATRREAQERAEALLNRAEKGGIGIILGAVPVGENGTWSIVHLVGVDLDGCLDEHRVPAAWAADIVKALATYTEISPSAFGLKSYFFVRTGLVRQFLDLIGVKKDAWGCRRSIAGMSGADHGPAIEIYTSARYFAVTGRTWPSGRPQVTRLDWPDLEALARLLPGPSGYKRGHAKGAADTDNSRSGKAWRAARAMKADSYEEMCNGLRNHPDPEIQDWVREKGEPGGERGLRRIWERGIADAAADPGETEERQYQFRLIRFNDITLDTTRPYLVHGLIPREGLIVVWGPPKCGKTFWVFDLMMHVALGWRYRDRRVEQSTVVYVACEGERGLRARKEAFHQKHLANAGFVERGRDPLFFLLSTRLDLSRQVVVLGRDIAAQIPPGPVGAIVIDTLNRSLDGSENKDEDMSAYIKAANVLEEQFKCAVIVIHHCGVNENRPRGHTSLTGAVAAQLGVQRNKAGQIVTEVEYMKDGPEGERIVSKLEVVELGEDEDGATLTSCVVEADEEEIATTDRTARLPTAQKNALDALTRALNEKGGVPPEGDGVPSDTTCVLLDVWRRYAYDGGISTSDNPSSKRQAFHRASTELIANELVGIHGELVWLTHEFPYR